MKILVAVKRVIDYNVQVRVKEDGTGVVTDNVKMSSNPPDDNAIEEAVKIKEAGKATEIIAITVGEEKSQETVRKALAVGADNVMLGSLLAGTLESPGQMVEKGNALYKRYRGSASLETKTTHGQAQRNVEGESTIIPFKGGVKYIIKGLTDGVRSALSYAGAKEIKSFFPKYIQVTNAGQNEAKPHLL